MWLVFGGRGSPCAGVFVVYIARAPGNYRADATPTRGVWSQIRSLRSAAIYHASIRSAPDSCLFGAYTLGHTRIYCTYRHVIAPVDRKCAPDFGGGHFQSDRVVLPRYRARWQCAPHRSALSELHQAGATESPESEHSLVWSKSQTLYLKDAAWSRTYYLEFPTIHMSKWPQEDSAYARSCIRVLCLLKELISKCLG
ncbi:hypothetical protein ATANTOWER_010961 [Ataeniobius toweri]|uniref:Uncharacterized protein n=1 Tax=Ataeniobius toweri TaxID=208326 RepID=A0ABU7A2J1_9TELE|nr:hypothetical protein [Ataeniobius toweri]